MVHALTGEATWTTRSEKRGEGIACTIKLDVREAGSIANGSSALLNLDFFVWRRRRRRGRASFCPSAFTCRRPLRGCALLTSAWRKNRCQIR